MRYDRCWPRYTRTMSNDDRAPAPRLPPPEKPGPEPLSEWRADEAQLIRGLFLEEATDHLRRLTESARGLAQVSADAGADVRTEAVDNILRHLHTLKGAAGSVGFGAIANAAHELEDLCAEVRSGALAPTPGILECIDEGVCGLRALLDGARGAPVLGTRPGQSSAELTAVADTGPGRGAGGHRLERRLRPERRGVNDRTVRVESERLDALLDGVGDLVILRTRVERRVRELQNVLRDIHTSRASLRSALGELGQQAPLVASMPNTGVGALLDRTTEVEIEFTDSLAHLDHATKALTGETESLRRTTDQLEEDLRQARLVSLDWVFGRLGSSLRELERTAGKQADLVVKGGDIELDKSVVEQISDPLLHLLRNAIAHGIEAGRDRQARGKPARGRIELSARQEGEFVFLTLEDDGNGIDLEGIRQALVRTGRLVTPSRMRDDDVLAAIFEPGFSIRERSDALAGRGMGLNIVKKSILRLGGDVTVEYKPGAFTRFRLSVPLTAAITQALLFKVGGQVYALPAAHVVEAIPIGPHDLMVADGRKRESVALPGVSAGVPIVRLQGLLGADMAPGKRQAALLCRYSGRTFITTCDKIIGPRTIVVRPLGPLLGLLPLYAGVTVSGSGKAQLVLDAGTLCEAALAPVKSAPHATRRSQPKIVIADDSRLSRETSARVLAAAGYNPITVDDGWEAWEILNERHVDAVVTDLEMPRIDGFELIARIRAESTLRGLPIVVLSSRTSKAVRDRATAAGANAVLPKIPNKRALTDALAALLGQRAERSPGS